MSAPVCFMIVITWAAHRRNEHSPSMGVPDRSAKPHGLMRLTRVSAGADRMIGAPKDPHA